MSQKSEEELARQIADLNAKFDELADILDRVADRLIELDRGIRELKEDEHRLMNELRDLPDDHL